MMTNSFTGPETQTPASAGVKTGIPILEIRRLDRYLQSMGILFGFGFFCADHGTLLNCIDLAVPTTALILVPVQSLIFDRGGVLVDSEHLSCGAWLPVLARYGVETNLSEIETMIGKSDQALLDHFTRKTGTPFPSKILTERQHEYFRQAQENLQSFPGLAEVLTNLGQRGIPRAVASSGHPDKIRFSLDRVGLWSHFEIVCSAVEVAEGKPAPDLFCSPPGASALNPTLALSSKIQSSGSKPPCAPECRPSVLPRATQPPYCTRPEPIEYLALMTSFSLFCINDKFFLKFDLWPPI